MNGIKYDNGKPDYTLLPLDALEQVVEVLTFGAAKYDRHNWKKVDNLHQRYSAAAMRHIVAYMKHEDIDEESGYSHLAHAICCLMFMLQEDADNINIDDHIYSPQDYNKDKPIVFFTGEAAFHGTTAIIHDVVNHPKLGRQSVVYTSKVLSGNLHVFETLNTIYQKISYAEDLEW